MKKVKIEDQELVLADSLNYLEDLVDRGEKFDCCIADPPYNISNSERKKIGWLKSNKIWEEDKKFFKINESWDNFTKDDYADFTFKWLDLITKLVKKNGNIIIFGSYHNIFTVGNILERLDRRIINTIVWYKRNAFPNITQRMFCESTEYMIWAVNNTNRDAKNWTFNYKLMKDINGGKQMRNVWDIPITSKKERIFGSHPAQKPIALIDRLILGLTEKRDRIIDPFVGSGTTLVSAARHSRKGLGIEINSRYFDIAKKRVINSNFGLNYNLFYDVN